jgi:glycosyltransferase involved in cell wall biosynthesis
MRRVLFVLEKGFAPQDQIRGLIYKDSLAKHGIQASYVVRQPAWVGRWRYQGNLLFQGMGFLFMRIPPFKWVSRLQISWNHFRILRVADRFDAIHFIKTEASAYSFIHKLKSRTKAKVGYDLADAIWLPAAQPYFKKIDELLRSIDIVSTDNDFSLSYVSKIQAKSFIWPPASQTEFFNRSDRESVRKQYGAEGKIILGWLGSPSTLFNLYAIWEPLEALFGRHQNLELWILGSGPWHKVAKTMNSLPRFEKVKVRLFPTYGPSEMHSITPAFDIGIFPQFDTEENSAHGATKVILYMAAGVPAVCSPVGQVPEVVQEGKTGFLAADPREWLQKLESLVVNAALRKSVGQAGIEFASAHYSLETGAKILKANLLSAGT